MACPLLFLSSGVLPPKKKQNHRTASNATSPYLPVQHWMTARQLFFHIQSEPTQQVQKIIEDSPCLYPKPNFCIWLKNTQYQIRILWPGIVLATNSLLNWLIVFFKIALQIFKKKMVLASRPFLSSCCSLQLCFRRLAFTRRSKARRQDRLKLLGIFLLGTEPLNRCLLSIGFGSSAASHSCNRSWFYPTNTMIMS